MALSQEEQQILQFGRENGKTRQEVLSAISAFRDQQAEETARKSSFTGKLREVGQEGITDVEQTAGAIGQRLQQQQREIRDVTSQVERGEMGVARGFLRQVGASARGISGSIYEGIKGIIKMNLPQASEEQIAQTASNVAQRIAETEPAQQVGEAVSSLQRKNPEVFQDVLDVLSVVETATIPAVGVQGTRQAVGGATKLGQRIASITEAIPDTLPTIKNTARFRALAPTSVVDRTAKNLADNVFTINKTNKRIFNNLKSQGVEVDKILAQRGLLPDVKDGKVDFDGIINTLDSEADEINEVLTRAIQQFPETTVSRQAIEQRMDEFIESSLDLKQTGKVEEFKTRAREELDRLIGDSQDIPLEQVQQYKIGQTKLSKQFRKSLQLGDADFHSAVADGFRKTIEEAIPDVQVRALNRQLGDLIKTGAFLERANGTAIKGGRLGTAFGSIIGAIVGGSGGGPVGAASGTLIGGYISNALQRANLVSPLKRFYATRAAGQFKNEVLENTIQYLDDLERGIDRTIPDDVLNQMRKDTGEIDNFINTGTQESVGSVSLSPALTRTLKRREEILEQLDKFPNSLRTQVDKDELGLINKRIVREYNNRFDQELNVKNAPLFGRDRIDELIKELTE